MELNKTSKNPKKKKGVTKCVHPDCHCKKIKSLKKSDVESLERQMCARCKHPTSEHPVVPFDSDRSCRACQKLKEETKARFKPCPGWTSTPSDPENNHCYYCTHSAADHPGDGSSSSSSSESSSSEEEDDDEDDDFEYNFDFGGGGGGGNTKAGTNSSTNANTSNNNNNNNTNNTNNNNKRGEESDSDSCCSCSSCGSCGSCGSCDCD